ncbi:MAG: M20/M25/M40 family metallo-hydrolase [Spirochaetales bacterium]|nr:M20/M25/M40 family metallo-hydrolase [Spirochaetales bacterium]
MKNLAVELLQRLIRVDTSNPPGNEWAAVELLEAVAGDLGFSARTFRTAEGRGNIAISYNGSYRAPLILLSHLDVVPAPPAQWTHPPFEARLVDGAIWGRGAIDTKQLTVMHLVAMAMLREAGIRIERDVLLVATADEEAGSRHGLRAMLATDEAAWFDGAEVLTEGGGFPLMVEGRPVYLVQTGQKGLAQLRFVVRDEEKGSPFLPTPGAAGRAGRVVAALCGEEYGAGEVIPATTAELIDALTPLFDRTVDTTQSVRERYEALKPRLTPTMETFVGAMVKSTVVPTIWKGDDASSGNDGAHEILVDARLLPAADRSFLDEVIARVRSATGVAGEVIGFEQGFESPRDRLLFDAMERAIASRLRSRRGDDTRPLVVPFISSGGSDGRFLTAQSSMVYGFSPVLPDLPFDRAVSMVHGVDERISVESLWFGCEVIYDTVRRYLTERGEGNDG